MAGSEGSLRLERRVMDSGATLLHQAPPAGAASFSVSFLAPAGWSFDPAPERGLATAVAELLSAGEGRFPHRELSQALDSLGGTLDSECGPERTRITVWGPEAHLDRLLPFLTGSIRTPRFDAAELRRVLRELHERQLREQSQPASRAEWELGRQLFAPGHPLRETGVGTVGSRARIDRTALRTFHARRYVPGGGAFIATTRLPMDEIDRRLMRLLPGWKGRADPDPDPPSARRGSPTPTSIDLPGRSQVEIRIGGPALRRGDPGYPAALLANEVLGGRPMLSRLFQRIREKEGLAYHCSSDLTALLHSGMWISEAGCGPKDAGRVRELLELETRRLTKGGVPQGELDRIRESVIGGIQLELEDTVSAHGLAMDVAELGLPADHLLTWPATLRAVTPAHLQEVADRIMSPAHLRTVIAGPLGP